MIEPITAEAMKSDFRTMLVRSFPNRRKRIAQIIEEVCHIQDCPVSEVMSNTRTQHIAWTRQDCMLALRENTSMSLPAIGRVFGRDHTTVKWGIERAKQRRAVS